MLGMIGPLGRLRPSGRNCPRGQHPGKWSLIRMLSCPARLPRCASSTLLGSMVSPAHWERHQANESLPFGSGIGRWSERAVSIHSAITIWALATASS
jgi:hypothetical protein